MGEYRYESGHQTLVYNYVSNRLSIVDVQKAREYNMISEKVKVVITLAVLAGLAGCASTSEIDSLRAEIRQANETAQSAAAKADAASQEAASATQTAEEAKTAAEEANSKIDRMFKKSMYK